MLLNKRFQTFLTALLGTFLFFSFTFTAEARVPMRHATVTAKQFDLGNYWVWLYYEYDQVNKYWKPYLEERYSVTRVNGQFLTIEMSSAPPGYTAGALAHHKFELDFKKCQMEALNPTYRHWTLKFYTKSYSPNWELVSNIHPNIVFTEKFNCSKLVRVNYEEISFLAETQKVFRKDAPLNHETSWYFLSHPQLRAVQWQKYFKPDDLYKSELVEWGNTR